MTGELPPDGTTGRHRPAHIAPVGIAVCRIAAHWRREHPGLSLAHMHHGGAE